MLVIVLYNILKISYLWYNVIGCVICILFAVMLQTVLKPEVHDPTPINEETPSAS